MFWKWDGPDLERFSRILVSALYYLSLQLALIYVDGYVRQRYS